MMTLAAVVSKLAEKAMGEQPLDRDQQTFGDRVPEERVRQPGPIDR